MAYIVMADIVMVYVVMTYVVMAYTVMARGVGRCLARSGSAHRHEPRAREGAGRGGADGRTDERGCARTHECDVTKEAITIYAITI